MFDAARSQDREADTSSPSSGMGQETSQETSCATRCDRGTERAKRGHAVAKNLDREAEARGSAELDEADFDSDAAEEELATLSAHLDAATYRQLVLIRRLDDSGHWAKAGAATCAAWLSYRIGMDLGTARDRLRVAHALAALPKVSDALRQGMVSYSKVRAIARVATPANEEQLLEYAQYTTAAQLEKICRGIRQAQIVDEEGALLDDAELVRRAHEARDVTLRSRGDGTVQLVVTLLPDEADRVFSAVERMRDAMREESAALPPTHADAFVRLVDVGYADATVTAAGDSCVDASSREGAASETSSTLFDVSAETPSREVTPSRSDDSCADEPRAVKRRKVSGGDTQRVVVQLAPHLLSDGLVANLDDGTWVSAETWRRVACDCALNVVLTDDAGSPLDAGRQTRTIPPALGRALDVRDGGRCRFPGCHHRRFLDRHHIEHWANGGATKLDNLVTLCTFHHQLVHEGGWTVELDGAEARFFRPDGRPLVFPQPSIAEQPIVAFQAAHEGLKIGPTTGLTSWNGKRPDYGLCVEVAMGVGRP
ncbi:MAG: DUF222 domain-containing protein [Polyangiales bacterium]